MFHDKCASPALQACPCDEPYSSSHVHVIHWLGKVCMVTFKMFMLSQSIDVHWVWWPTCWAQCSYRKSTSNSTGSKPSFWLSRHICLFAQECQIRKLFLHIFCLLTSCSCCSLPKREIPSIDSSLSYQLLRWTEFF